MELIDVVGKIDKSKVLREGKFYRIKPNAFDNLDSDFRKTLLSDGIDAGYYIFFPDEADLKYRKKSLAFKYYKISKIKESGESALLENLELSKDVRCVIMTPKEYHAYREAMYDKNFDLVDKIFDGAETRVFTEEMVDALRAEVLVKELVLTRDYEAEKEEQNKKNKDEDQGFEPMC